MPWGSQAWGTSAWGARSGVAITPPVVPPPPSTQDDAANLLFGRDLFWNGDFAVTTSGDWVLVEDIEALRQSLLRRYCTSPGEWSLRPDYGVGLPDFLEEEWTETNQNLLTNRIREQTLRDSRVDAVEKLQLEIVGDDMLVIRISVRVKGRTIEFRPFNFPEELL